MFDYRTVKRGNNTAFDVALPVTSLGNSSGILEPVVG